MTDPSPATNVASPSPQGTPLRIFSLYDTLAAEVRPLDLRQPGRLDMYVCGPTVYDHPHLGHARSALTYDTLRRYLEWCGIQVRHVSNVTDVDDKIIARAHAEGRTETEVAAEWEDVHNRTMAALGVLSPHEQPRATEWVAKMVTLIGNLIDSGTAYATQNGVYLRVRDVSGYGELVHRSLDDLRSGGGARVDVDTSKEDPLDFALWKAAKSGEPTWGSPWGLGRPGWHIECVTMSLGLLGDGFDLHGGGNDLVFPHHTNERAEALALGYTFARHWMHNAMLNVDGRKMGKSFANYRTVEDLLAEHTLNGSAFRLLVLQTHYRKNMEVNPSLLQSARAAIQRLDALQRRTANDTLRDAADPSDGQLDHAAVEAFHQAMGNDLGTPEAVAVLFDTSRRANTALDRRSSEASVLVATVQELIGVLGLLADLCTDNRSDDTAIDTLVEQRQAARSTKDWATADALRGQLSTLGVVVEDSPHGPKWYRR